MKQRERIGSRLGFILLSAGCAIGCGNVWKFPWMCGEYGGGGFVLIYVIFLVILGLPVLTMEFSMGRGAQASPVYMYRKLRPEKKIWNLWGMVSLVGNISLMAFYCVVAGWIMYYFCSFAAGNSADLGFEAMISNPLINVVYLGLTVMIAFAVLSFQLQGGLEKVNNIMMCSLLVLLIVLTVHSLTMSGAKEGLSFYLVPDFSKITGSVVVGAMNQAFFTLSTGMGSMAIFGSYIDKDRSMLGEAVNVVVLDTIVAILAGLIIFPACYTFGLKVDAGPSLLFNTMTAVFNSMNGGRIWGTLFFLLMIFAAMSTVLAVCENILAMVRELTGWSRPKGSLICGLVVFLLGLTTALGYSVLHFQPFAEGTAWLDFWDFIVSSNILPLGSLVLTLFCCSSYGWGWEAFIQEANIGSGIKVVRWMKPIFCFVVPVMILFIYIYGMIHFSWR